VTNSAPNRVHVVALGASTPVGRDAWSSAAAVRAGITGFADHPFMIDAVGEPIRVAMAPWLDPAIEGTARLDELLCPAIDQVLHPLSDLGRSRLKTGFAIGLPAPRPGLPADLQGYFERQVADRYRFRFTGAFPAGHAAGLLALDAAHRALGTGALDACVVAGVDSYMGPETLEWLEENDQLHGAGPLNNAWGFVPGEGAGAVLLASARAMEELSLRSLATVAAVGLAYEPNRIKTETVCVGQGLTQAFHGALAALPSGESVTDVYCDMNGEPYRADEYGFACLRTKEWFTAASDFVSPADCWGDVAAATGPLCVLLAAVSNAKAYAKGSRFLLWASSEGGERAAALLNMLPPETA
jgi:3-oxoacyl-[acyl-carrier-protein] synthase-1